MENLVHNENTQEYTTTDILEGLKNIHPEYSENLLDGIKVQELVKIMNDKELLNQYTKYIDDIIKKIKTTKSGLNLLEEKLLNPISPDKTILSQYELLDMKGKKKSL